jgi:hypothetical protein
MDIYNDEGLAYNKKELANYTTKLFLNRQKDRRCDFKGLLKKEEKRIIKAMKWEKDVAVLIEKIKKERN